MTAGAVAAARSVLPDRTRPAFGPGPDHAPDPSPAPSSDAARPPEGLDLHLPFCAALCPYCDFVVVAGALQQEGASSRAKVLETVFQDGMDSIKFDLASAYPKANGLRSLTRTFVFLRQGDGALTVRDEVEFDGPQEFGTALITLGKWSRDGAALVVEDGGESVRVEVSTDGPVFSARNELIEEDVPRKPTRIGINLTTPVRRARIEMKITPVRK